MPACLGDGRKTVNTNSPHCRGLNPRPAGPLGVRVTGLLRAGVLVLQTIRDRLRERVGGFLLPPRTTSTPHQPVERSRGERPRVYHPPNRLRAQPPQRPRGSLAMGPWRASRFRSCSGGLLAAGTGLLASRSLMCFKRNLLSDPKVRRIPVTPTDAGCSRPDRKPVVARSPARDLPRLPATLAAFSPVTSLKILGQRLRASLLRQHPACPSSQVTRVCRPHGARLRECPLMRKKQAFTSLFESAVWTVCASNSGSGSRSPPSWLLEEQSHRAAVASPAARAPRRTGTRPARVRAVLEESTFPGPGLGKSSHPQGDRALEDSVPCG